MTPVNEIWESALQTTRINTEKELELVKRITNQCYFEIAVLVPWQSLRKEVQLDLNTATDSTGLYLPSDLIGIESVWDVTDKFREYVPRDEGDLETGDDNYRWYYSEFTEEALHRSEEGLSVDEQGTTATLSPAIGASANGEYIKFGLELGYYKLTSTSVTTPTFSPKYWGDTLDSVSYQIRPKGTRKFTLVDQAANYLEEDVDIYYWAYPQPLYVPDDLVLLPNARALELMVLVRYLGQYKRREQAADRYRRELNGKDGRDGELAQLVALNPKFNRRSSARDKRNQPLFRGGRKPYKNYANAF